jgi:hypothetical protein
MERVRRPLTLALVLSMFAAAYRCTPATPVIPSDGGPQDSGTSTDGGDSGPLPDAGTRSPFSVSAVFEAISQPAGDGGYLAPGLLGPMKTGFVLRAFFKWGPLAQTWASELGNTEATLRRALPNGAILQGGITAAFLQDNPRDTWPDGGPISAASYSQMLLKNDAGQPIPFPYDPDGGWIADFASPTFRSFLVGWVDQQVAAGMDALFFDQVYYSAEYRVSHFHESAAVLYPQYAAYWADLKNQIRADAAGSGRRVLIAQNGNELLGRGLYRTYPAMIQGDDILHGAFDARDFDGGPGVRFPVVENFAALKASLDSVMGSDVPIVYFIDWPQTLTDFSRLSSNEQITVLKNLDSATRDAGIFFAFPVYGGVAAQGRYDSVTSGTYDAMLGLVQ